MKIRNKRIYSTDQAVLLNLQTEYIMLGFDTTLEPGVLTVHATRKRARKKKERKAKRK